MSGYDIGIVLPATTDKYGQAYTDAFVSLCKDTYGYQVIEGATYRDIALYKPTVTVRLQTATAIDSMTRGFSITTNSYTSLVVAFIAAAKSLSMPVQSDPGYTVDTANEVDIDMILGYTSNNMDAAILATDSVAFMKALKKAIDAPTTYAKITNGATLTLDTDMSLGLCKEETHVCNGVGTGVIQQGTISNNPLNYLHIAETSTSKLPYRWGVPYKCTNPEDKHLLIFVARVPVGLPKTTLHVYCGDTPISLDVSSHDWQYLKYEFYPQQQNFHNAWFPFSVMTSPTPDHRLELPFSINVNSWPIVLDNSLPFSLTASATYNIYFGLGGPGQIDIGGVWVCKRGFLDELDDPVQVYTPYPSQFDPYGSVTSNSGTTTSTVGGTGSTTTPSSSTSSATVTTPSSSITGQTASYTSVTQTMLSKASTQPLSDISSKIDSTVSAIENAQAAIQAYTTSFTTIMGTLSSLSSGKVGKYVDARALTVKFASIETAMQDVNVTFEKKSAMSAMLTKMKAVSKAAKSFQVHDAATMVTSLTKAGILNQGAVKSAIVNIGTELSDINKRMSSLGQNVLATADANLLKNAVDMAVNGVQGATALTAAINKIDSVATNKYAPGFIKNISKALNKGISNPLTNDKQSLLNIATSIQNRAKTIVTGSGKIDPLKATIAEMTNTVNNIANSLDISLTSPTSSAYGSTKSGQWNRAVSSASGSISGVSSASGVDAGTVHDTAQPIAGVDYSVYQNGQTNPSVGSATSSTSTPTAGTPKSTPTTSVPGTGGLADLVNNGEVIGIITH